MKRWTDAHGEAVFPRQRPGPTITLFKGVSMWLANFERVLAVAMIWACSLKNTIPWSRCFLYFRHVGLVNTAYNLKIISTS